MLTKLLEFLKRRLNPSTKYKLIIISPLAPEPPTDPIIKDYLDYGIGDIPEYWQHNERRHNVEFVRREGITRPITNGFLPSIKGRLDTLTIVNGMSGSQKTIPMR